MTSTTTDPVIRLIPRVVVYACAFVALLLCLRITFPLPRAELQLSESTHVALAQDTTGAGSEAGVDMPPGRPGVARYVFPGQDKSDRLAMLVEVTAPTITVFLNGEPVQTVHGPRTIAAPNSAFLLVQFPPGLVRSGPNAIDFELQTVGSRDRTKIWRVFVGPYEELQESYPYLIFLTQTLPALNFAWRTLLAVMLLGLFLARRHELKYLLLSLALLCGAPPLLRMTGAAILLPESVSPYLGIGIYWQTAFLAMFGYWTYAGRLAKPLYLLFVGAAFVSALVVFGPLTPLTAKFGPAFGLFCLCFSTACCGLSAWKKGELEDHIMFCNFAVVSLVGLLDVQSIISLDASVRLFRINTSALIIFLVLSALLISRLIASLKAVDRFNVHLTNELHLARNNLREALEREHASQQATALQKERERLMRDLHDGVSGRIVSLMALCELKGGGYREMGDTLRGVLQDLRLVIASLEDVGGDLQQVFLTFRDQTDLQLRRIGVRLHCRVPELPPIADWMPGKSLHVYRILQECVTNASKHSGCQDINLTVSMIVRESAAFVRIVISDAGRGGATDRDGSFGLQNMRKRAAALGGELDIQSGPTGTVVRLDVPVVLVKPLTQGDPTRLQAVA